MQLRLADIIGTELRQDDLRHFLHVESASCSEISTTPLTLPITESQLSRWRIEQYVLLARLQNRKREVAARYTLSETNPMNLTDTLHSPYYLRSSKHLRFS